MNDDETISLEAYQAKKKAETAGFRPRRLSDIMAKEYPPLKWSVEGYIAEGLTVLAGVQKSGKSYLAMELGIAVAMGGYAMGSVPCEQGDVLYLDFENGERRIQSRVKQLVPDSCAGSTDWQHRFLVESKPIMLNAGLLDWFDAWRYQAQEPRLIVVDVFQCVRPPGRPGRNPYEEDYAVLKPLQDWAKEARLAVVLLHHTRKGGADDPLEALSGSNAISGCADATLLLKRDGNGTSIIGRGRDFDLPETALHFNQGRWTILGEAAMIRRSDQRSVILQALADNRDEPMSPSEIAGALGLPTNNVKQLLFQMAKADEVKKTGRGRYVHPNFWHPDDGR